MQLDNEFYNNYFGKPINSNNDNNSIYNNEMVIKKTDYNIQKDNSYISLLHSTPGNIVDKNISNIDYFGKLLSNLLNAAWGKDWGICGASFKNGNDPENITLPQVTYDIYNRETKENFPIKPKQFETINEIVNGKPTGDMFVIYRQWFDCITEFNSWGHDVLEARKIQDRLEKLLTLYNGYFRNAGITNMYFLKEIPSQESNKYIENIPMKCMLYNLELEKIYSVRASKIKEINIILNDKSSIEKNMSIDDIYKKSSEQIKYDL